MEVKLIHTPEKPPSKIAGVLGIKVVFKGYLLMILKIIWWRLLSPVSNVKVFKAIFSICEYQING